MRRIVPSALLLLTLGPLALGGCAGGGARRAGGAVEVTVSVSACGRGWSSARPGPQQFVLHNADTRGADVDLIDAASGAVFAELEPLAPGSSAPLQVDLGSGRYAFRCAMEDEAAVTGPAVTIAGHVKGRTPGVRPVDEGDLVSATKAYEGYVRTQLPGFARAVGTLRADLVNGRLAAARRDWLPAHLDYIRLGAAYGAFGDLDAGIDARADGLPLGVRDPSWAGLHRLEFGLWHGASATALAPVAAQLVRTVGRLQQAFPHAQLDPLELTIRAHEITEDAVEFALTGRDDYGSHSGLATAGADLDATRTVLGLVRSLLAPRYPGLAALDAQLTRTGTDLDALRQPDGAWPALAALAPRTRERVNGDVSELAELLAPVAAVLEPRRTS